MIPGLPTQKSAPAKASSCRGENWRRRQALGAFALLAGIYGFQNQF
jgi:hypothetical protein